MIAMAEDFQLQAADAGARWTLEDTLEYLNNHPLPVDLEWHGRKVLPTYQVSDYAKWLKETPYHRGLFRLVHDVMTAAEAFPQRHESAQFDELVRWIRAEEVRGQQTNLNL